MCQRPVAANSLTVSVMMVSNDASSSGGLVRLSVLQQPQRDDFHTDFFAPSDKLFDLRRTGPVTVLGARTLLRCPPTIPVKNNTHGAGSIQNRSEHSTASHTRRIRDPECPQGNTPTGYAYLVAMTAAIGAYQALKPRMRGWLHARAVPAAIIAGVILLMFAPPDLRFATFIYVLSTVALFGISATYHRGTWGPRTHRAHQTHGPRDNLRLHCRYVHADCFDCGRRHRRNSAPVDRVARRPRRCPFRVFWVGAPRWLIVPIYISMGWAAVFSSRTFGKTAAYLSSCSSSREGSAIPLAPLSTDSSGLTRLRSGSAFTRSSQLHPRRLRKSLHRDLSGNLRRRCPHELDASSAVRSSTMSSGAVTGAKHSLPRQT